MANFYASYPFEIVTGNGSLSIGPFGSSPNANAGVVASNILTLEPADATHPGGVSTTTQTLAGNKTFSGTLQGLQHGAFGSNAIIDGTPNGLYSGPGSTTTSTILTLDESTTSPNGLNGIYIGTTLTPSSPQTLVSIGMAVNLNVAGANTVDNAIGAFYQAGYNGSSTITNLSGLNFSTYNNGGGTATNMTSLSMYDGNYSGTCGAYSGVNVTFENDGPTTSAKLITTGGIVNSSTVTDGYSVYISSSSISGGSITNNYGIYLENQNVGTNTWAIKTNSGKVELGDNLLLSTLGKGLQIKTGTNSKMGTAVLSGGTVTVSNTSVTSNSLIFLTSQVNGGTPGFLRIGAKTASTSFVITSSSGTDTSTVAWMIVESIP